MLTRSQLNQRRYAINDDTLYVAPSDSRTDYSQPPMSNFYPGVLNTGHRRRYAHPALSGSLPTPWLPSQSVTTTQNKRSSSRPVVVSLRRKKRKSTNPEVPEGWATTDVSAGTGEPRRLRAGDAGDHDPWRTSSAGPEPGPTNMSTSPGDVWGESRARKVSYNAGSGVIALPEDHVWDDEEEGEGSDEEARAGDRPPESPVSPAVSAELPRMAKVQSTYYPHGDRRKTLTGADALFNPDGAPVPSSSNLPE